MKKFVVLFCMPSSVVEDWVKNVDEAERTRQTQQMMGDWQKWVEAHKDAIVSEGLAVGKTKRVTKEGVADARNEINYSMVVQAETHDAAAQMFVGHPHFMIPQSYIDISDTSGPGM
jgi:hypothetical protein